MAEKCYMLAPFTSTNAWTKPPVIPITATKFIIQPINQKESRWGIIVLALRYAGNTDIEPFIDEECHEDMEDVWKGSEDHEKRLAMEDLHAFAKQWCQASTPAIKLSIGPITWVEVPQQPDFASCGVFVMAQVYSYVAMNLRW
ncbi:hypothetical protein PPTG_02670 [Phytophthora nicotianae INRA-310]|uniref:Ubiquitin-like protease family profile domain-containing protein n=1 Tax=Phytophthora nicotianae (strain INRA-310) TaxID=761204 RepID=W2RE26_PHYN3|nr:hypothetical protein PPTG_02670 [Phytophthora nicotianae INRA-310]ETN22934.1 hypothetical protein PPTG_02670 [Phytophthora nicotianae INRA-310]